jgi:hypothetical protein
LNTAQYVDVDKLQLQACLHQLVLCFYDRLLRNAALRWILVASDEQSIVAVQSTRQMHLQAIMTIAQNMWRVSHMPKPLQVCVPENSIALLNAIRSSWHDQHIKRGMLCASSCDFSHSE